MWSGWESILWAPAGMEGSLESLELLGGWKPVLRRCRVGQHCKMWGWAGPVTPHYFSQWNWQALQSYHDVLCLLKAGLPHCLPATCHDLEEQGLASTWSRAVDSFPHLLLGDGFWSFLMVCLLPSRLYVSLLTLPSFPVWYLLLLVPEPLPRGAGGWVVNGMMASHSWGLCEDKASLMPGRHKGNRVLVTALHACGTWSS